MWLKVVPDTSPNADGRWIEVPDQEIPKQDDKGRTYPRYSWLATERAYRSLVPPGEHMVGVSSTPPPTPFEDRSGESMHVTLMRGLYK